jgi:hypothetical protein
MPLMRMNCLKSLADPEYRVPRLRPVVADDPRLRIRILLAGSLRDDFDIFFEHCLADLPVQQVTAVAVQHTAQAIKRPGDVDVADIDVPVAVRMRRLVEAFAFGSPLRFAPSNHIRGLEYAIDRGRTGGHDIRIEPTNLAVGARTSVVDSLPADADDER